MLRAWIAILAGLVLWAIFLDSPGGPNPIIYFLYAPFLFIAGGEKFFAFYEETWPERAQLLLRTELPGLAFLFLFTSLFFVFAILSSVMFARLRYAKPFTATVGFAVMIPLALFLFLFAAQLFFLLTYKLPSALP